MHPWEVRASDLSACELSLGDRKLSRDVVAVTHECMYSTSKSVFVDIPRVGDSDIRPLILIAHFYCPCVST